VHWGRVVYRGIAGNYIDDEVAQCGRFEAPEVEWLRAALKRRGPDAVFIDVGANVGTYALPLAATAALVVAIEPYPPVFDRLEEAVRRNDLRNVRAYPIGYSDKLETLAFVPPPPGNLGLGSFDHPVSSGAPLQLPLAPGDRHLAEIGVRRVDAIKIDVEGFEKPVVRGLASTIARDEPVVLIEINGGENGFETRADLEAALPRGYAFAAIVPHDVGVIPLGFGRWVYGSCVTGEYRFEQRETYPHGWDVVGVPARDRELLARK
jgi:FkbM family methyltransferase